MKHSKAIFAQRILINVVSDGTSYLSAQCTDYLVQPAMVHYNSNYSLHAIDWSYDELNAYLHIPVQESYDDDGVDVCEDVGSLAEYAPYVSITNGRYWALAHTGVCSYILPVWSNVGSWFVLKQATRTCSMLSHSISHYVHDRFFTAARERIQQFALGTEEDGYTCAREHHISIERDLDRLEQTFLAEYNLFDEGEWRSLRHLLHDLTYSTFAISRKFHTIYSRGHPQTRGIPFMRTGHILAIRASMHNAYIGSGTISMQSEGGSFSLFSMFSETRRESNTLRNDTFTWHQDVGIGKPHIPAEAVEHAVQADHTGATPVAAECAAFHHTSSSGMRCAHGMCCSSACELCTDMALSDEHRYYVVPDISQAPGHTMLYSSSYVSRAALDTQRIVATVDAKLAAIEASIAAAEAEVEAEAARAAIAGVTDTGVVHTDTLAVECIPLDERQADILEEISFVGFATNQQLFSITTLFSYMHLSHEHSICHVSFMSDEFTLCTLRDTHYYAAHVMMLPEFELTGIDTGTELRFRGHFT